MSAEDYPLSLAIALAEFALAGRLAWSEVWHLVELAAGDTARALHDVELEDEWNGHILLTRQRMVAYETVRRLLDEPAPEATLTVDKSQPRSLARGKVWRDRRGHLHLPPIEVEL